MRIPSILRIAAFAAALAASTGIVGAAFADDGSVGAGLDRHDQIKTQGSSTAPYDSPEFVLPPSQTFS